MRPRLAQDEVKFLSFNTELELHNSLKSAIARDLEKWQVIVTASIALHILDVCYLLIPSAI